MKKILLTVVLLGLILLSSCGKKEEKVSTVSVKAPERVDPPAPKKEWYNMSIEEQLREEMKEL